MTWCCGCGTKPSRWGGKAWLNHVTGVNVTPLKELITAVQAAGVPIWVCGACAVARQIGGRDLVAGASIKGMPDYIKAGPSVIGAWSFSLCGVCDKKWDGTSFSESNSYRSGSHVTENSNNCSNRGSGAAQSSHHQSGGMR